MSSRSRTSPWSKQNRRKARRRATTCCRLCRLIRCASVVTNRSIAGVDNACSGASAGKACASKLFAVAMCCSTVAPARPRTSDRCRLYRSRSGENGSGPGSLKNRLLAVRNRSTAHRVPCNDAEANACDRKLDDTPVFRPSGAELIPSSACFSRRTWRQTVCWAYPAEMSQVAKSSNKAPLGDPA